MQTTQLNYRVDRRQISMIRFIFEAYEGIAVVTTLDAASGRIILSVAPGCETMVDHIMMDLGKDFLIERLEDRTVAGNACLDESIAGKKVS